MKFIKKLRLLFLVGFVILVNSNIARGSLLPTFINEILYATSYKLHSIEGKHSLTLQWISWDKPGSVIIKKIKKKKDEYTVEGKQEINEEYVKIEGIIIQKSATELYFKGTIITKVKTINGGKECVKEGPQTFLSTKNRKYWRLQNMQNCEGNLVTDYIDIYF